MGGTAIVYDVTGHDEYIVHQENSYVVAKDDEQKVVDYLRILKQDESELQRLKDGAAQTAGIWPDWHSATMEFEEAIQKISSQKQVSPNYLKHWIKECYAEKKIHFDQQAIEQFTGREQATGSGGEYDRHNFVQIYKVQGNTIDPDQKWFHYLSDEPTTITTRLTIPGLPFWIRIDPSVRIGVVLIDSIKVTHCKSKDVIIHLSVPGDFDDIYLDGTIKRIGNQKKKAAFVSYGNDPWFFLPQITEGEIGEELEIAIHLREIGMTQFANRYCRIGAEKEGPDKVGIVAKIERLFQKK